MKLFSIFSFFILTLNSCSQSVNKKDIEYDDDFIKFALPKYWQLENSDLSHDNIKMYSIADTFKVSSFLLSLTIDSKKSIETMNEIQINILKEYIPHAEYSATKDTMIEKNPALYFNYSFKNSLNFYGTYIAMKCEDKSININYQYSLDERARVLKSIPIVLNSLECK